MHKHDKKQHECSLAEQPYSKFPLQTVILFRWYNVFQFNTGNPLTYVFWMFHGSNTPNSTQPVNVSLQIIWIRCAAKRKKLKTMESSVSPTKCFIRNRILFAHTLRTKNQNLCDNWQMSSHVTLRQSTKVECRSTFQISPKTQLDIEQNRRNSVCFFHLDDVNMISCSNWDGFFCMWHCLFASYEMHFRKCQRVVNGCMFLQELQGEGTLNQRPGQIKRDGIRDSVALCHVFQLWK